MRAEQGARPGLTVGGGGGQVSPKPHPRQTLLLPFSSNFSNYKARFSMPGDNQGLWYR